MEKYEDKYLYDEYVDEDLDFEIEKRDRYQNFVDIYETMLGLREGNARMLWVDDAFADGELCASEYEKMRGAYERLCERLGVKDEDKDLNIMVESMEKIQKELCRRFCFLANDFATEYCKLDK